MLPYAIFTIIIVICLISIIIVLFVNYLSIRKGELEMRNDNANYLLFKQYTLAFYKYFIRRVNRAYKFTIQYALHLIVRVLYFINILTDKFYSKSRNVFVQNATKNKSTVVHFWNHLKVYKREIDEEKE